MLLKWVICLENKLNFLNFCIDILFFFLFRFCFFIIDVKIFYFCWVFCCEVFVMFVCFLWIMGYVDVIMVCVMLFWVVMELLCDRFFFYKVVFEGNLWKVLGCLCICDLEERDVYGKEFFLLWFNLKCVK